MSSRGTGCDGTVCAQVHLGFVRTDHPLDENLDPPAGRFARRQPRGNDAGVVDDKEVAAGKFVRQVAKPGMANAGGTQQQQSTCTALRARAPRNAVLG